MVEFSVTKTCGKARAGTLRTEHGEVATPLFMPCGTCGTVKGVTPDQLREAGVRMVLANTYHLMLRPGADVVAELGGLHEFMAWDSPILTDSGGYQVFSLAPMRRISDEGVVFRSHVDGATVELTPETCVAVQVKLGADVIMQLDECPPAGAARKEVAAAVARSAAWAKRCKDAWDTAKPSGPTQALFGIQQGGHVDEQLPQDRPRYLMGVGEPRDVLAAVRRGVDMFDCVLPTRNGRNGQAFTWNGRLRLRNAAFARDARPIDPDCPCYACRNFSRAALRHYFLAEEMLGPTLVTIHNLAFFARFTSAMRRAIVAGDLEVRASRWMDQIYSEDPDSQAPGLKAAD